MTLSMAVWFSWFFLIGPKWFPEKFQKPPVAGDDAAKTEKK